MADNEYRVRITADTHDVNNEVDNASQQLNNLNRTAQQTGNVFSRMWDRIVSNIRRGTEEMESTAEEMSNIGENFDESNLVNVQREIDRTTASLERLQARSQRMEDLGANTASNSFRNLQYDIASAQDRLHELNGSLSDELTRGIQHITNNMQTLANTRVNSVDYEVLETRVRRLDEQFQRLIDRQEALDAIGVDHNSAQWRNLQVRIEAAGNEIQRYQRQMQEMRENGTAFQAGPETEAYQQAQQDLAQYQQRLEQAQSDSDRFASEASSRYGEVFSSIASGAGSTGAKIAKAIGGSLAKGIKNIPKMWQKIGHSVSNVIGKFRQYSKEALNVDKLTKKMTKSLTSLVTMLTSRIKSLFIDTAFRDMKKTFGEIATISPRFNEAFSSMIDSVKNFGAQIVAAVEPIVSIVTPIISAFVDKLTSGADAVAQFMARVTGNDTYIKATKGQSDYAASIAETEDNTKKASKAAKEYKATVLSFDELHKLDAQKDGDASEITGIDSAAIGQAQTDANAINSIADEVYNAFSRHDFYGAGAVMAKGINEAFEWLDNVAGWSKNAEKLTKLFKNIVNTVNGFVDNIDTYRIGQVIGDVVNSVIHAWDIFTDPVNGIHFTEIGKRIGELVLGLATSVDWNTFGRAFINSLQAGVKIINGVLSSTIIDEVTGEEIGIGTAIARAIGDLFDGALQAVNPEEWGMLIANIVNTLTSMIIEFFADGERMQALALSIATTINTAIENIKPDDFAAAISSLAESFVAFISTMLSSINWGGIWDTLCEILGSQNFDWGAVLAAVGIAAAASLIASTLTAGIPGAIVAAVAAGMALVAPEIEKLYKAFEIKEDAQKEITEQGLVGDFRDSDYNFFEKIGAGFNLINPFGKDKEKSFVKAFGSDEQQVALKSLEDQTKAYVEAGNSTVAFSGHLLHAQDYVDLFAESSRGLGAEYIELDGEMRAVSDQMRQVAAYLIDQGKATLVSGDSATSFGSAADQATGDLVALQNSLWETDTSTADLGTTATDTSNSLYELQESLWDTDTSTANLGAGFDYTTEKLAAFGSGLDNLNSKLDTFDYSIIQTDYGDAGRSYNVPKFASGGIVGDGQLFVANENGTAELIGGDGRGNTAIVNNDQIISAVITGVKQAVIEAGYAIADTVAGQQGDGGDIILEVDSVELAKATNRGQAKINRRGNHTVTFA